jgi:hypothetical protein
MVAIKDVIEYFALSDEKFSKKKVFQKYTEETLH